jgi:hypothetical protein
MSGGSNIIPWTFILEFANTCGNDGKISLHPPVGKLTFVMKH